MLASFALLFMQMRINGKFLPHMALLIFSSVFILYMNGSGFGNVIYFAWPFAVSMVVSKDFLKERYIRCISRVALLFWVILSVKASFFYASYVLGDDVINPNTTALLLVYLYFLSDCGNRRARFSTFFRCAKAAITLFGIVQCHSRASLIAFVFLVVSRGFLRRHVFPSKARTTLLVLAVIAVGAFFPFLYIFLSQKISRGTIYFDGKDIFTGREFIWMKAIDYVRQNPSSWLIGTGYNETFYSSFNLHNAYWQMFALYGLPMACLYFMLILKIIRNSYKKENRGKLDEIAMLMILAYLIVGYFEVTLEGPFWLLFFGLSLGVLSSETPLEYSQTSHRRRARVCIRKTYGRNGGAA